MLQMKIHEGNACEVFRPVCCAIRVTEAAEALDPAVVSLLRGNDAEAILMGLSGSKTSLGSDAASAVDSVLTPATALRPDQHKVRANQILSVPLL